MVLYYRKKKIKIKCVHTTTTRFLEKNKTISSLYRLSNFFFKLVNVIRG